MTDIEKQEKLDASISNSSVQNETTFETLEPFYLKAISFLLDEAENRGIERVPEEERTSPSIWEASSMWFSANMVIATFSLGALGPAVFGLNFYQSMVTAIFFSVIGSLPVAFFSVFGMKFGLRQMVLSRFLIGDIGARIFSAINIVACVGWGSVNIIASAELLHIVNNGCLPPWAGCLILVVLTILVSFFGYKVIHIYEEVAWIPNFIIFFIIIARFKMSGQFSGYAPSDTRFPGGETIVGSTLSFGATIFGFAAGWTTYAADYTVYMPKNTSNVKVFLGLMAGLLFPLCFVLILGIACGTSVLTNTHYSDMYASDGIGGLVYCILVEDSLHGFGQFCCVVLALSTVANNIPNMYSIALCSQTLWSPLAKIPRPLWTIAGNLCTLAICIPAYYKFTTFMSNFMGLISYYLGIYIGLCMSEHFIYRKGKFANYDYLGYSDKSRYPIGLAALFGFCCGVAGVVVGMNITWYSGPIARKLGEHGGDIGFELGCAFAIAGHNMIRPFELKYFGR